MSDVFYISIFIIVIDYMHVHENDFFCLKKEESKL